MLFIAVKKMFIRRLLIYPPKAAVQCTSRPIRKWLRQIRRPLQMETRPPRRHRHRHRWRRLQRISSVLQFNRLVLCNTTLPPTFAPFRFPHLFLLHASPFYGFFHRLIVFWICIFMSL